MKDPMIDGQLQTAFKFYPKCRILYWHSKGPWTPQEDCSMHADETDPSRYCSGIWATVVRSRARTRNVRKALSGPEAGK